MDVEVKNDKTETYLKDNEVKSLIKRSQNGEQEARDLIVQKNMRLVWSVVQRFLNRGYEPQI
jgi:RNA polymerase sporulation-specific sigma factor